MQGGMILVAMKIEGCECISFTLQKLSLVTQRLEAFGCAQGGSCRIQIWQRSNWHWYLKREMQGLSPGRVFAAWQEEGLCLTILTSEGLCSEVEHNQSLEP